MLIPPEIKERLKKNWGPMADALECFCEVKLHDLDIGLQIYIYAMNPDDDYDILSICISRSIEKVDIFSLNLNYLCTYHDIYGAGLSVDTEFRRIKASVLLKKLQGRS